MCSIFLIEIPEEKREWDKINIWRNTLENILEVITGLRYLGTPKKDQIPRKQN